MNRKLMKTALTVLALAAFPAVVSAGPAEDGQAVADKALAFLKKQQQPDGSFAGGPRVPSGVSAMVLKAIAQSADFKADAPESKKAVEFLLSQQQPDGGIYKGMLANYNTAICISGLAAVGDPKLKEPIGKAVGYLKANQFSDAIAGKAGEKIDDKHPFYGGWGYGGNDSRPDVSNTGIVLDALKDAGLSQDDPAYKNAVAFLSKMQNRSETNPAKWASDDGGFIYSAGKEGEGSSSAGEYKDDAGTRRLRSYGSMTYSGLKSFVYAGISKDDPRVKAAWGWVTKNWTVDENPGMALSGPENAKDGIYYYYHVLGRSLRAYGEPVLTDGAGKKHDWRVDLIAKLKAEQKENGSFVGDKKWMENNPVIATVMATLALQDALEDLKKNPPK